MNSSPPQSLNINGANIDNFVTTENNTKTNMNSSPPQSLNINGAIQVSNNNTIDKRTQQYTTKRTSINSIVYGNVTASPPSANVIITEQLNDDQEEGKQHHNQQQRVQTNQEKLAQLQALAEQLGLPIEPIKLSDDKPSSSSPLQKSASKLQATYRMHKCKQTYKKKKWKLESKRKEENARVIQNCFRNYKKLNSTKPLRRRFKRFAYDVSQYQKHQCAIKIQSICRKFLVYNKHGHYLFQQKKRRCALKVQSIFRAKLQKYNYNSFRNKIIIIQSMKRKKDSQKIYATRLHALITIQRIRRRYATKRKRQHLTRHRSMLTHINQRKETTGVSLLLEISMSANKIQKMYKARYHLKCTNTLKIQRVFRGYKLRKTLSPKRRKYFVKVPYQQMIEDCIILQKAWRNYKRKKLFAHVTKHATKIKNLDYFQAKIRSIKLTKTFKTMRTKAIKIQTQYRCYISRKKYLQTIQYIIIMQKSYRRFDVYIDYQIKRAIIIHIQSSFRMKKPRRFYLKQRQSILAIQARYRSFRARRTYLEKIKHIVTIQKNIRRYDVYLDYQIKRALIIHFQSYAMMHRYRRLYRKKRTLIIKIQYLSRKWKKRRHKAAVKIQSVKRMVSGKATTRNRKKALIALQRWFKYIRSRCRLNFLFACVVLQRTFKRMALKWRIRKYIRFHIYHEHVIKAQAIFRGRSKRKKLTEEHFATVISKAQHMYTMQSALIPEIQILGKHFNRSLSQKFKAAAKIKKLPKTFSKNIVIQAKQIQDSYDQMREGAKRIEEYNHATKIQTLYRRYQGQKNYGTKKVKIVIMQKNIRRFIHTKRVEKRKQCVLRLQGFVKVVAARLKFKQYIRVITIFQSKQRMFALKEAYKTKRCNTKLIQKIARGKLYRKKYLRFRSSTILIQSIIRCKMACLWKRRLFKKILKIQTVWRRYYQQKAFKSNMLAKKILKIQTLWRRYYQQKIFKSKMLVIKPCAIKIQTFLRVKLRTYKFQRYVKNIRILQRLWRRKNGCSKYDWMMRVFKAKTEKRRKYILLIQSFARMVLAKQHAHTKRTRKKKQQKEEDKLNKIVIIQRNIRMYLAKIIVHKLREKKQETYIQCAVRIQSIARVYLCKKLFCVRLQTVVKIQSIARMYLCKRIVHNVRQLLKESNEAFVIENKTKQEYQTNGLEDYDRILCSNINMYDATNERYKYSSGVLLNKTINDHNLTCTVMFDNGTFEEILPASIERIVYRKGDIVYGLNKKSNNYERGIFSHFTLEKNDKEGEVKGSEQNSDAIKATCVIHFERKKKKKSRIKYTNIVFDTPINTLQATFQIGDDVETRSPQGQWKGYYPGKVTAVNEESNTYTIHYDDDEVATNVPSTLIFKVLTIGEVIYATTPEFNFSFHRGRIKKVVRTHGYTIHFDDGSVQEIVQRENIRVVFDMFENKWELDFQMPLTRTRS
jgi:hypothetical protein